MLRGEHTRQPPAAQRLEGLEAHHLRQRVVRVPATEAKAASPLDDANPRHVCDCLRGGEVRRGRHIAVDRAAPHSQVRQDGGFHPGRPARVRRRHRSDIGDPQPREPQTGARSDRPAEVASTVPSGAPCHAARLTGRQSCPTRHPARRADIGIAALEHRGPTPSGDAEWGGGHRAAMGQQLGVSTEGQPVIEHEGGPAVVLRRIEGATRVGHDHGRSEPHGTAPRHAQACIDIFMGVAEGRVEPPDGHQVGTPIGDIAGEIPTAIGILDAVLIERVVGR